MERPHGGPAARAGGDDVVYGPRDCRSASYACIPAFGMEIQFVRMARWIETSTCAQIRAISPLETKRRHS